MAGHDHPRAEPSESGCASFIFPGYQFNEPGHNHPRGELSESDRRVRSSPLSDRHPRRHTA